MDSITSNLDRACPFCAKLFQRLGNHLPFCPKRDGKDYSSYLSQKTLKKRATSKKQLCPHCGKAMRRLDTHLRVSALCKQVVPVGPCTSETGVALTASVDQCQGDSTQSIEDVPLAVGSHSNLTVVEVGQGTSNPPVSSPDVSSTPAMLRPFNCPKTDQEWSEADHHLASVVVPAVLSASSVEEKNLALCKGVYTFFSNKYGVRSKNPKRKTRKRKSARVSIDKLREERNKTRNDLRRVKKHGRDTESIRNLAAKFHRLLRQYKQISRAEQKSVDRKHSQQERKECAKDFHRFAKRVLDDGGKQHSNAPAFDASTARRYFHDIFREEDREFQQPHWLPEAPPPSHPFVDSPFTLEELMLVIKKTKAKSSPSPFDQITYLVFRQCPSLGPALLDLFNKCWEQHRVPKSWKQGVVRLIPKTAADTDPHLPANFRPIALTSCVGKLFTTILKNRWLQFMIDNRYLDTTVQKAFLPGVSGCLEHYQKLSTILKDAHKKHRSLAVCWLDLANAYGSVHHELISYCLQHYHAPRSFLDTVSNIYSDLSATISSEEWNTTPIPLKKGVFQGDPLSPIIFNTVMSTLTDTLRVHLHRGYTLSGSSVTTNVLLYADDACLVADGTASCQLLLSLVESWLQWSGMMAKIPKCFSLAIQASTAKRFDPGLILHGQKIPFIGSKSIKFLGGPLSVPTNRPEHQQNLETKLTTLMERVDNTAVTRKQKLLLYKAGVCPRISWDLAIMDLSTSWVSSALESVATRFLKKWSGLARPANTARLYLPKDEGGLALPPISLLYKRLKVSQGALLLTSRDRVTQRLAHRTLQKEEAQMRVQFKPVTLCRERMVEDPGARRQTLAKRAKNAVMFEDAMERREYAESLPVQGQLMRVHSFASDIWATAVGGLGSEVLKFALNAATDTLPHNSNLAKWRNGAVQEQCKLCGKKQTLLHVLNNCEVALKLRRYNTRHDKILSIISELAQSHLPAEHHLLADCEEDQYNFPSHVVPTTLRPDLVIWSDFSKLMYIIELTICFESGFEEAARRKITRYSELAADARTRGYRTTIIPIQIGSRGVLEEEHLNDLRRCLLPIQPQRWKAFLITISTAALTESHRIWCDRNKIG